MKITLRKIFFWLTFLCIILAIFRRPVNIIYENLFKSGISDIQYFLAPFYHIPWLFGFDIEYPLFTSGHHHFLAIMGVTCLVMFYTTTLILGGIGLERFYNKYIK